MLYAALVITAILIFLGFVAFKKPGAIPFVPKKTKKTDDLTRPKHVWETSSKTGVFYCNVCSKIISGWFNSSQMLECKVCGGVKHFFCRSKQLFKCKNISSPVVTQRHQHQWLDGNLPMNSICNVCHLTCGSIYGLDGSTCLWCQKIIHKDCKEQLDDVCDFGKLQKYIISPSEIKVLKSGKTEEITDKLLSPKKTILRKDSISINDYKLTVTDEHKIPIIAIVNKTSGGQVGNEILKSFYRYLNPIQVIDLIEEGLERVKMFKQLKRCRVIVGGGDGTIGSVLTYLNSDEFNKEGLKFKMSVGILPLGTGNDLSNCLGWGNTFISMDAMSVIRSAGSSCEEMLLDQWLVTFTQDKPAEKEKEKKIERIEMYNYCGIGLDAKMALNFHNLRKSYPYLFKSRIGNKFIYTQKGLNHLFAGKKIMLQKHMKIYCDDKLIMLPDVECLVVQSINYWGGGVADIWGDSVQTDMQLNSESFFSDSMANESEPSGQYQTSFKKQSYCDGILEVVGFTSILHMGQTQTGLSKAIRICQGSNLEIHVQEGMTVPLQIDGEPFESAGPFKMKITLRKRVDVIVKKHSGKTPIETKILKVLDWAEGKDYINETQRHVLLDQFLRTLGE